MTLHIFNPEHDIALAANLAHFTAPHAGRQLRYDLGFLPALWAQEGDMVLTDDVTQAQVAFHKVVQAAKRVLKKDIAPHHQAFIPWKQKALAGPVSDVQPWGWDLALLSRLKRLNVNDMHLPTKELVQAYRQLSHRRTSTLLLPLLQNSHTVGQAFECTDEATVYSLLDHYGSMVLKAPWSSSGRGIRFVSSQSAAANPHLNGWLRHLIEAQGSVMAEPYYDKVKDFGMEFHCQADGTVRYLGLSLFHTANGAYTGNIIATEQAKRNMMSRYLTAEQIDQVQAAICQLLPTILKGRYQGPLGIDMMVVRKEDSHDSPSEKSSQKQRSFLLHPCVEINLRRTMGHVALSLTPADDDLCGVMRINYSDNNYKLTINNLQKNN